MRPSTRYKKIDNEHFEKTDELTGEKKIINFDELSKELEQFTHDFHSENYKKLIGDFNESQNKLSLLFCNYIQIIDKLIQDYDEELFFLDSGCIYEDLTITTEEGEIINLSADVNSDLTTDENISKYKLEISRVIFDKYQDKKAKADNVFLEITGKIDNGEKINYPKTFDTLNEIDTNNKANIDFILDDLIQEGKIKFEKKIIAKKEIKDYVINVTYKELRNFIEKKMKEGIYKIKNVDIFITTYIKNKKMCSLKQTYYMFAKRLKATNNN